MRVDTKMIENQCLAYEAAAGPSTAEEDLWIDRALDRDVYYLCFLRGEHKQARTDAEMSIIRQEFSQALQQLRTLRSHEH